MVRTMRYLLFCTAFVVAATSANAATINFDTLPTGTVVSTQFSGLVFSLAGSGPVTSGSPVVDQTFGGLMNSPAATGDSVDYPTATILNIAFATGADSVSFTFDNYGDNGTSAFTALGPGAVVVDTAIIPNDGSSFQTVTVTGTDITDLQITNGEPGTDWGFAVGSLTYTPLAATPEPSSLMLLGTGILGLAGMARRKFSR
jgi:hypothetical protein